jgi:hypothetical protein
MVIVPVQSSAALLAEMMRLPRTLRLFVNDVIPGDETGRGDLQEAPGDKGYAAVILVPAQWTITPGKPPLAEYPKVVFTFTGAMGNVYGYFVTAPDGTLRWVERFLDGPVPVRNNDDQIKITPRIVLGRSAGASA